jgi:hypothetical protein
MNARAIDSLDLQFSERDNADALFEEEASAAVATEDTTELELMDPELVGYDPFF